MPAAAPARRNSRRFIESSGKKFLKCSERGGRWLIKAQVGSAIGRGRTPTPALPRRTRGGKRGGNSNGNLHRLFVRRAIITMTPEVTSPTAGSGTAPMAKRVE